MAWNLSRSGKIPEKGRTTCVCQSQILTSILKALPRPTLFKGTNHLSWFPTPSWVLSTKSQTNGFAELSAHSLLGRSHRLTNLNMLVQVGTSTSPFLLARSNSLLSVLKPQSNVFPASFFFHTPHLTQQRVYASPPCSTQNSFLKQFFVLPFSSQCSADFQTHSNRNRNPCTNTEFQQVPSPVSSLAPFLYTFAHIFSSHTSPCIHWNQHQLYFYLRTPMPSALPSLLGSSPPLPCQFLPFCFDFLHRLHCLKSFCLSIPIWMQEIWGFFPNLFSAIIPEPRN